MSRTNYRSARSVRGGRSAGSGQRGRPNRSGRRGRLRLIAGLVGVLVVVAAVVAVSRHHSQAPPPPPVRKIVTVVIPEGFTRAEIAQVAKAKGMTGSYLAASARSTVLAPTRFGAPADTPNLEGFLFPATYEVYAGSPAAELVGRQLEAFQERFGPQLRAAARHLGESSYELLTVASMIEREAETETDRPLIAAVIYNRLRLGMPLGIDATIRYALHDYTRPLTEAQLRLNSPYNTRLHTGLPPTPISNPGMASIEAAAHPAHVAYLYYVAAANGCGELVFSDTYSEFLLNAAAYRQALAANGGRVPSCTRR